MHTDLARFILVSVICCFPAALPAQTRSASPPPVTVEPGLEAAVNWKWTVEPSPDPQWGLDLSKPQTQVLSALPVPESMLPRPSQYEVQRGDALVKIGKKFNLTVDQLKAFNKLASDVIQIGDILKIPTVEELRAMAPPSPPPPPVATADPNPATPAPAKSTRKKKRSVAPESRELRFDVGSEMEAVLYQVFLDREQFAVGVIDGKLGPTVEKVMDLYKEVHPELNEPDAFKEKAKEAVVNPFTQYVLGHEDFRFIAPRLTDEASTRSSSRKGRAGEPPLTYEELISPQQLLYRSAWEFVAERFHCEEAFLRKLNPKLKSAPAPGAEFKVPNVIPFEIDKVVEEVRQPQADPQNPVKATVVDLSRLEITRADKLIAVMPVSSARPGLRGRGTWTILSAITGPRLTTLQEPRVGSSPAAGTSSLQVPAAAPRAQVVDEQHLGRGPNNPVGIAWLNLAKGAGGEPLPYGLHGTSIPERMRSQEGLGGFRLTNWDIARAVRLLPAGTPLVWK